MNVERSLSGEKGKNAENEPGKPSFQLTGLIFPRPIGLLGYLLSRRWTAPPVTLMANSFPSSRD
jgi:hypothetical protein